MKTPKIVVYTAITGNYDSLRDPLYVNKKCDYICFTDNNKITSDIWYIKPLQGMNSDPVRSAKKPKILPHLFFEDYDISVWIDGNFSIVGDLCELAEKVLSANNLTLFRHPEKRASVYEEAKRCIDLKKVDLPS